MFARALIVLLLVLNLGVALWWALRPASTSPATVALPAGTARLQLLTERPVRRAARVAVATPPSVAAAERCYLLGPFADARALAAARARLQSQVIRMTLQAPAGASRGWRVWLPPLADRAAADAMAARVTAAGFHDYYIVPDGSEPNSIALGRFGNEAAARHLQQQLQAAGFPAQAEPLSQRFPQWLVLAAGAAFDADAARAATGVAEARSTGCSATR